MKRFFLLILSIWHQQFKLYLIVAITGALIGILVLAPSYDYIYAREQTADPLSSIEYVLTQIGYMLTGKISRDNFVLIMFYAEIGAMLGLFSLVLYKFIHKRVINIDHLKSELNKNIFSIMIGIFVLNESCNIFVCIITAHKKRAPGGTWRSARS